MKTFQDREILVAVSFRDFIGDYNSQIQDLFLEHIKNQTYQNYKLVVTNFREKNVRSALEKSGVKYVFHQSKYDTWFSWTEVITNTFPYLEKGKQIILWTNADNLFEPNLFEEIIHHFESKTGGISFPSMFYYNIEDYHKKRPNEFYDYKRNEINTRYEDRIFVKSFFQYDPTVFVPEWTYLDGDLLTGPEIQKLYLEHQIMGRPSGVTHHYMFMSLPSKIKNLLFVSRVHTIENSRIAGEVRNASTDCLQLEAHTQMLRENLDDQIKNEKIGVDFYHKLNLKKKKRLHPIFTPGKMKNNIYYVPVGTLWQKALYYLYLIRYILFPRTHHSWIIPRGIVGLKKRIHKRLAKRGPDYSQI